MKRLLKLAGALLVGLIVGIGVVGLALAGIIPVPFGPIAEARAGAEPARPPVTVMYPTKERVVNLTDRETPRFLKVQVTLEFIDRTRKEPPKGDAVKAQQEEFAKDMAAYSAIIEDALTMVLSSKTSTQLLDPAGKEALKRELIDKLNRTLFPDPPAEGASEKGPAKAPAPTPSPAKESEPERERVVNVYFPLFIIQ